ncbi:MAG: 2'-5' RNA ligase family protein, partial [Actinobacteria bacterium]|nr:2'-5' RNA ligase family protein [Actinomycetota bacterium]
LRLPEDVLDALAAWQEQALQGAGRIVQREHLHVTLAFLGSRPAAELAAITGALAECAGCSGRFVLEVARYRETRSVGMLVLSDPSGRATALAGDVQERLEELGIYRREGRPWLPHVTVARFRERPRLQPGPPPLGPFAPSDAAAFLSRLHPSGARYEVLQSCSLGG